MIERSVKEINTKWQLFRQVVSINTNACRISRKGVGSPEPVSNNQNVSNQALNANQDRATIKSAVSNQRQDAEILDSIEIGLTENRFVKLFTAKTQRTQNKISFQSIFALFAFFAD